MIEAICDELRNLVCAGMVGQGLVIVAKVKLFIAAFPWYYSTAFAAGAIVYFLPEILNMMDEWIGALRSVWQNVKTTRSNVLLSISSTTSPKATQLEKCIKELETENKKMQKLLKENQEYAEKNSTRPFNIFIQNSYSQTQLTGQRLEKQPIKTEMIFTNYGAIETSQCKQSYHVPIEFIHR